MLLTLDAWGRLKTSFATEKEESKTREETCVKQSVTLDVEDKLSKGMCLKSYNVRLLSSTSTHVPLTT